MISTATKQDLADAGLHFVLAATYLGHQPHTPEAIVAAVAYIGLAALRLAERDEQGDDASQGEESG